MDKACNKIPYAIIVSTGEVVEAEIFDSSLKGEIICPYCGEEIIYKGSHTQNKNGEYRKKHFSHKSKAICVNKVSSEGESIAHKDSKEYIYKLFKQLKSFSSDFELIHLSKERQFINEEKEINRIADVYVEFKYKGELYKQAYEIQYSNIPEEEFDQRHNDYKILGIQDIWLIGMQFKDLNKSEVIEYHDSYFNDETCQIISNINENHLYFNGGKERPIASRLFNQNKRVNKLLSKSISLFNKVSNFQEIVYFIDKSGLFIPNIVTTKFICAQSNYLGNDDKTTNYDEYKNNSKGSGFSEGYNRVEFITKLTTTKEIHTDYKYNNNLLKINTVDLNSGFFINGKNKLFHFDESEILYEKKKKSQIEEFNKQKRIEEEFEENIEKYKYINPKFAQIYLIRLLSDFIIGLNNLINSNKSQIRKTNRDSLQWINDKIIGKQWGDKNVYGFFSSINTVLEKMAHITPQFSTMMWEAKLKELNTIINYIEKVECNIYEGLSYEAFMKEFNLQIKEKGFYHTKFNRSMINGLNDESFKYGIRTCLQSYCNDHIKGNVNLFLYKSLFGNKFDNLKNNLKKEQIALNSLYNDIKDTY